MRSPSDGRALSPATGTTLLVAIVVLLAGLGATMVFGMTDEQPPAPEVSLSLESTDRPVAQELRLEAGEALDGSRVVLRGVTNGNVLSGRTVRAGESTVVFPTADTVRVVWFADGENRTSYTLATFQPAVTAESIEADERCSWVQSRTSGGVDDVRVRDTVVDCDVKTDGSITIDKGGTVIGDVASFTDQVDLDDGYVYGSITSHKDMNIDDSTVAGRVEVTSSNGDANLDDTIVGGSVTTPGEEIDLDNVTIYGSVDAGSGGKIYLEEDGYVAGDLRTRAAEIDVDHSTVGGDVSSDRRVKLRAATVEGSVHSDDEVELDGVTVEGHVYVPSGDFDCTDSTINGESCAAYSPKDPDDY